MTRDEALEIFDRAFAVAIHESDLISEAFTRVREAGFIVTDAELTLNLVLKQEPSQPAVPAISDADFLRGMRIVPDVVPNIAPPQKQRRRFHRWPSAVFIFWIGVGATYGSIALGIYALVQ